MTEQNTTPEATAPETTVHHQTRKAADMSLAKKAISPDSHRAVLAGDLSLEEARELGREGSPFGPAPKTVAKNDRSRECACGCGERTAGGVWRMGHDARLPGLVLRAYMGEIELTDEQHEHAQKRDLFAKAEAKVAARKAKEEAKAARKAEAQRRKEGEAERRRAKKAEGEKS